MRLFFTTSKSDSLNIFQIVMNKIVNDIEEDMGILPFQYNAASHSLISKDTSRNITWEFTLTGKKLHGTLIYRKVLYSVNKEKIQ